MKLPDPDTYPAAKSSGQNPHKNKFECENLKKSGPISGSIKNFKEIIYSYQSQRQRNISFNFKPDPNPYQNPNLIRIVNNFYAVSKSFPNIYKTSSRIWIVF